MEHLVNSIKTLGVGATSLLAVDATPTVMAAINPQAVNSIGQLIIQTIIGLITVITMLRKARKGGKLKDLEPKE